MRPTGPTALTFLLVTALAAAAVWLVAQGGPTTSYPEPGDTRPARQTQRRRVERDAADVRSGPSDPSRPTFVDPPPGDVPEWRGDESLERRVVGEDGVTPVEGVRVTLLVVPPRTASNRRPRPIPLATTTTDADGRFRFTGLARRAFQVRVEARHRRATTWTAYAGSRPERRGRGSGLAPGDMQVGRDLLVHFVVVDERDQPVQRAVGEVLVPGEGALEILATVTCDDKGRADWLPPGGDVRAVVFRVPGRATEVLRGWRRGGETRVVLRPGHAIAGVVIDAAGQPVQGATVSLGAVPVLGDRKVITGRDGAFRFEALRSHPTMRVTVRKGTGAPAVVSTPTGREDVRIEMAPRVSGGTVRGVVLRPDGRPAVGAVVDLSAECGAGGRFELACSRDGAVTVGARYGTVELPVAPHRWHAEFGRADLELSPGGTIEGVTILLEPAPVSFVPVQLVDADDVPLAGVAVGATGGGFGEVSDADGRAVVAFLDTPAGTTKTIGIGSVAPTSRQSPEVVTRTTWGGLPERIVVEEAPHVSVEIAGVAKEEWDALQVRAVSRERFHGPVATRVGKGPEFEIGVLDDGEHLVMIRYPSGAVQRLVPAGGRERRLHVDVRRGARLRVTITDADGGTPRDVRRVALLWERDAPWGFVQVGWLQRGDEGEWAAERLPAGRFVLAVERGFRPSAMWPVQVRETGTNTARVVLPRTTTISGQVRGAASEPLGGCTVSLRLAGGRWPSRRLGALATTGADGRFELTLDPIDGAYLAFEREGHATRLMPVDGSLASRAHRVSLEREGTVLVQGGFVAGARLPGSDVWWEPYVEPSTVSPAPGGTPLRRLPEGDVELITMGDDGSASVHAVRVVPGRTVELDLSSR